MACPSCERHEVIPVAELQEAGTVSVERTFLSPLRTKESFTLELKSRLWTSLSGILGRKGQLSHLWNPKDGKSSAKTYGWRLQSKAWPGEETTIPKERVTPYKVKLSCCCCFLRLLLPNLTAYPLGNVKERSRAWNIGLCPLGMPRRAVK